jgi:hypothetical protein
MTINENRQRLKNEALNSIRKLYDPKFEFCGYSNYWEDDGSYREQRDSKVNRIIEKLEKDLKKLNIPKDVK